jgi:hypothetical protein
VKPGSRFSINCISNVLQKTLNYQSQRKAKPQATVGRKVTGPGVVPGWPDRLLKVQFNFFGGKNMKRFTGILAAAAIAIAPMSASALEALTDSAMNDVTAQAGVSIAVDDIVIYQNSIADTTYTDSDSGLGIKIDYAANSNKVTILNAITDDNSGYGIADFNGMGLTEYTAGTIGMVGVTMTDPGDPTATPPVDPTFSGPTGFQTGAAALSIDIGTCDVLTAGKNFNGMQFAAAGGTVGGVIIGLPTLEITTYRSNDTKTISMVHDGGAVANSAVNVNKEYIKITKDGYSKMAILGGTIEIAPH